MFLFCPHTLYWSWHFKLFLFFLSCQSGSCTFISPSTILSCRKKVREQEREEYKGRMRVEEGKEKKCIVCLWKGSGNGREKGGRKEEANDIVGRDTVYTMKEGGRGYTYRWDERKQDTFLCNMTFNPPQEFCHNCSNAYMTILLLSWVYSPVSLYTGIY